MKSVIVLWFFIVIIFVVLGLGFAYVIQQQQVVAVNFKALEQKAGSYDAAIKKLESQLNADADALKSLQNTLMSSETDKNGVKESLNNLTRQIEEVQARLGDVVKAQEALAASPAAPVAPVPDASLGAIEDGSGEASVPAVELGTIPVEAEKESL